jgi:tetratricopeptide (TPR) repeat protein
MGLFEPSFANPNNYSEQFKLATQAYLNKDYKEAEKIYLQLLSVDPQSPAILQNLGLTYYSLEDKGRALAFFRSLTNLEPRNIEAYKTIDFIESNLANKDFVHDRSFIEDINLMLLRWVKLPELLIIHFITLLIFGLVIVKRMAKKKRLSFQNEKYLIFTPQTYAGLTFIIILTFFSLLKISFSITDTATIISKNKLSIKSGPSENSADLYELFEGFEVSIDSTFKDWTQITYQDQYTGWVKNNTIWKHIH